MALAGSPLGGLVLVKLAEGYAGARTLYLVAALAGMGVVLNVSRAVSRSALPKRKQE
jgi:uncharacterized membrane protein YeaQ/YmgE (transglycosylase-associated protein family)